MEDVATEELVVIQGIPLVALGIVLELESELDGIGQAEIEAETGTDAGGEESLHLLHGEAVAGSTAEEYVRAEETCGIVAEDVADVNHCIHAELCVAELADGLALDGVGADGAAQASTKTEPRCDVVAEADGSVGGDVLEMRNIPVIGGDIIGSAHHFQVPTRSEDALRLCAECQCESSGKD